MKLEDIHRVWEEDAPIDEERLEFEAMEIPKLHAKYMRLLSDERMILKQVKSELQTFRSDKRDWYDGSMAKEDLERLGWAPYPKLTIKAEIESRVEADQGVILMNLRVGLQMEKVEVLGEILKSINNRSFAIGHAINWIKFKNGLN